MMKKILYLTFIIAGFLTACSSKTGKEWFDSAEAKFNKNDYQGAIKDYDEAIEMESGNTQAIFHRGNTKTCVSDFKGAIADYSLVLKLDSLDPNAYSCRANCKKLTGDFAGAIPDFTKALKLKIADTAKVFLLRGSCRVEVGDLPGALVDLNKAIELTPKSPDAYFYRGKLKIASGLKSEACADLKQASALGKKEADELMRKNCN